MTANVGASAAVDVSYPMQQGKERQRRRDTQAGTRVSALDLATCEDREGAA